MALGNNLKKKKLIPESDKKEKKDPEKKVVAKKKVTRKKQVSSKSTKEKVKPASGKPEAKKKLLAPTKTQTKTEKSEPKTELIREEIEKQVVSPELPMYIAKELLERKKELKARYQEEIASLKGKPVQFVILTIGGEKYALDIDNVREVVPLPVVSKTPNTPNHINGIANVRGNNYVVFDLSKKFNVIGEEFARYLLILDDKDLHTSIPLSVLPTTYRTYGDEISLSPQLIEDALLDASYIKGLIQSDNDLIYFLDIIELLRNDKAIVVPDQLLKEQDG